MSTLPQVDRVLQDAVEHGDVPGVAAAVATRDGGTYLGAYGRRRLPDGAAMTTDSVFWIASMTKAITSAAAMQLVEQGRLGLDTPIAPILPQLAAPQILDGFDAAGQPRLRPAARPITLRHLITHTAGFVYDTWNADMLRYRQQTETPRIISGLRRGLDLPLGFEPGERWDYGIGIDFVGLAVEAVTGQLLGAYFQDHLFGPLGMADTGFKIGESQRQRLVGMHSRATNGALTPMAFELNQTPEYDMGGGGLYSTAPDYLAFARMIIDEGQGRHGRVLQPETVRLMAQNAIGDITVAKLVSQVPTYSNDAEFFPGMVKQWSPGFMINHDAVPGRRRAGSLAWAGIANTYYWIDPTKGVAGVLLCQLFPFADHKTLALLDAFETAVYASIG